MNTIPMKKCIEDNYNELMNGIKAIQTVKTNMLNMLNKITERALKYFGKTDEFKTSCDIDDREDDGLYEIYIRGVVGEKREFGVDAMSVHCQVFFDTEFFDIEHIRLSEVKEYDVNFRFSIFRKYRPKTETEFIEDPDCRYYNREDFDNDFEAWDLPTSIKNEDLYHDYEIIYNPYRDEIISVDTLSDDDVYAPHEPENIQEFYRMFKNFINSFEE